MFIFRRMIRASLLHRMPQLLIRRCFATSLKDFETLYDLMEIEPYCTKTEIRESWLRLSMLYHPDLNRDSEENKEKFMKIKDAYKILIDDQKREEYNNKIGFIHHDPPPNYHREWTLQGEKDRVRAQAYKTMWDESQIRELMSSERLREVNWKEKNPAERYKILQEEQMAQDKSKHELERLETPTIREASWRYAGLFSFAFLLSVLAYRISLIEEQDEIKQAHLDALMKPDVELENGTVISGFSRRKDARYSWMVDLKTVKENLRLQSANE
ncbi:dnaJ homolog subfamily C member 8 [Eurytemora carolleeae]|uniref:dnaJ homolog subfamily C member 8 n=1 Tax=Eurytemora carolleeae TaxID=1294199 RepID=UPI000C773194|nr:dnaJ homolog subfamily C member 8 [Eurytemora carolleeae]|eukprot:XP_023319630.1 dnaJ homolog subfamily C member 8-like [Eurytemora affinis]